MKPKILDKYARRFLRDLGIWIKYRVTRIYTSFSDGEECFDYSLELRWKKEKYVAFAYTGILPPKNGKGKEFWIWELQVLKKFQGRGFGSYLLRRIIADTKPLNLPIVLFAHPGGAGGIRFEEEELKNWYARHGFVEEGGAMVRRFN